ncbi:hypothetical protein [Streptomyces sp. NPDC126514]|uniref:hypothetical protein n=1 Tax=Streptomyces sp. NPDC126514 TaxID=3155210 RepID=UPI003330B78C
MTVTQSSAAQTAPDPAAGAPARLFGPRGRHRRPRPRKALLAAGGLALAAGALSLVRLTPDSVPGGLGASEAEPWPYPDGDADPATDHATSPAAAVGPLPRVSPSATSVLGGPDATATATPAPGRTGRTAPATPPASPPALLDPPTTIPEAPTTDAPQSPPATTPPAPQPTAPSRPARTPAPQPTPGPTDRPGVCLPVIGLCVDPLAGRHG